MTCSRVEVRGRFEKLIPTRHRCFLRFRDQLGQLSLIHRHKRFHCSECLIQHLLLVDPGDQNGQRNIQRVVEKQPFSIGMLKPTPGIVDEYFNGSTGDGNEGDSDMRGPWTSSFALQPVESQMNGGKGLSLGDINGKINGEDSGKQDDAQKATTSLGDDAIGKKGREKGKISHSKAGTSSGQR